MPISAADTISLAFQHTKRQLVQPFRLWQWTRLAFVGLLAGEMGSGGGCNFSRPFRAHHQAAGAPHLGQIFPKIDPVILASIIAVLVVTGTILMLVMMYISSVMRFILFDSVLTRECHIRDGWNRRQGPGWNYFLWKIVFALLTLAATVALIGVPAAFALSMGWFSPPREHVLPLVLGGIVVFGLFALFFLVAGVVFVFTKDFVVPQMALEGIGVLEGWRRLWPMIQMEKGAYALYVIMKIGLAIGAGIVVGIASAILVVVLAVPAVAVALAAVFAGKTAGLSWTVFTVTAAVVAVCILFAVLFYLVSLVSVPVIVFFPAYAMYFFAARYRPLTVALYPEPPASPVMIPGGSPPPFSPPPLPAV
ncbi:MAG: hypothetical protein WCF26_11830 [Candidatus Sulfotelmatobacter sp.]